MRPAFELPEAFFLVADPRGQRINQRAEPEDLQGHVLLRVRACFGDAPVDEIACRGVAVKARARDACMGGNRGDADPGALDGELAQGCAAVWFCETGC